MRYIFKELFIKKKRRVTEKRIARLKTLYYEEFSIEKFSFFFCFSVLAKQRREDG